MARVSRVIKVPLALLVAWTSMDLCHVPSSEVPNSRSTNYLMIGNPGTGKSTILNCLLGRPAFKSGVSYGSGMTYEFDVVEEGRHKYMDTPGLSDVNMRQKAADAITEALKQNGYYKIFFVVGLQNGRVRPEDIATMKLVLDAAPITEYGVIINQLSPREYKDFSGGGDATKRVLGTLWATVKNPSLFVHPVKRDDDLEDEDDVVKPLPGDLVEFMRKMPGTEINPEQVITIQASQHEEAVKQLEMQVTTLMKDKKKLEETVNKVLSEKTSAEMASAQMQMSQMSQMLQIAMANAEGNRNREDPLEKVITTVKAVDAIAGFVKKHR